jgi:asparagine synthetase B (glutamine-hydrolysing)
MRALNFFSIWDRTNLNRSAASHESRDWSSVVTMRKARPPDRRMKLHCYRRSEDRAYWDRLNQALYIDMQLLPSGNNLVKLDRMGMTVSLEARTPFLDYRMMEFAFRMPGHFKLRDGGDDISVQESGSTPDPRRPHLSREADVHRPGRGLFSKRIAGVLQGLSRSRVPFPKRIGIFGVCRVLG